MDVSDPRAKLVAPVAVDVSVTATPAQFVRKDSIYKYIVALLDSGAADLGRVGTDTVFLFPLPPGFALFATPATFLQFNRALAAKANVLRATDSTATQAACGGNNTTSYATELTAMAASFLSTAPTNFGTGAFYDFGTGSGDVLNNMSEPLSPLTFFALQDNLPPPDTQPIPGQVNDQRVVSQNALAASPPTPLP